MSHRKFLLVCAVLLLSTLPVWSTSNQARPQSVGPLDEMTTTANEIEQAPERDLGGLPCGIGHQPSASIGQPRVVGGHEADPGEFPWMVNMKYQNGMHFCGGVIIDERHILTAKHCINNTSTTVEQFIRHKFYIGDHDQTSGIDGEQTVDIERIMLMNPSSSASADDIALLRTTQAMKFRLTKNGFGSVNRICLPRGENFKVHYNRKVTVAGWGWIEGRKTPTKLTREVDVSIKKCIKPTDELSRYTLCATADNWRDACGGDSGGPLIGRSVTGQFVLAGIVQTGPLFPCGDGSEDGIYANVYNHLEWIDKYLNN